ncbi:MAG: glycosyltransferase family 4 protein [Gaiellaceae bacterium]
MVLTTSYPRGDDDFAGRFIADAVERLRGCGVTVDVLAPFAFRHFGLAHGDGVLANARRRPWAVPALLASMAVAARRAAAQADLLHAHWLPAGAAAAFSGRPFVVTVHGSDLELARRAPALARAVFRSARRVICVSRSLAEDAERLGASRIRVVGNGVELPTEPKEPADPPHVLFAGRLAPEKGIEDLLAAADGLELVIVGDGPLREYVPGALGFVRREELSRRYEAAAVVACPSLREGFGLACAEAMAHARPVVATAVGNLRDLVVHEETGLLVPPHDPPVLRAALERLLRDDELRRRMGAAGRKRIAELSSWDRVTDDTLAVYDEALAESALR